MESIKEQQVYLLIIVVIAAILLFMFMRNSGTEEYMDLHYDAPHHHHVKTVEIPVIQSVPAHHHHTVSPLHHHHSPKKEDHSHNSHDLNVDGYLHVSGSMDVDQRARFADVVGIVNGLEVGGPTVMNDNASVVKNLEVSGLTNLNNDAIVTGHLHGKNNLTVDHNAKVGGSLEVGNVSRFRDVVDIKGDTYINKDAKVFGNTRLEKRLDVGGMTAVHNKLDVHGVGTFRDNLGVGGNARVRGNAFVDKDADVGGRLRVFNGVGSGYGKHKEVKMVDNTWGDLVEGRCPNNHYLCGIKARYEQHTDRNKDRQWDTGINGLYLKCCPFN